MAINSNEADSKVYTDLNQAEYLGEGISHDSLSWRKWNLRSTSYTEGGIHES